VRIKSLKNKISLINIAILAVVLFGYTVLVYFLMHSFALRQIDKELTAEAQEITDLLDSFISRPTSVITTIQSASSQVIMRRQLSYAEAQNDALTRRILETVDRYELRDDYVVLLDPSGQTITLSDSVSPELQDLFLKIFSSGRLHSAYKDLVYNSKPLRLYTTTIRLKNGDNYVIMLATSLRDASRITKIIFVVSAMVTPFILILAGLIGRWLAARVLKTVVAIAQAADQVSHVDLSQRVTVQDTDEEMKRLGRSFNGMIGRLEKSFQHISEFSEHVAHELKTPLTVIRGEAEVALRRERTPEEYRQVLQIIVRDSLRTVRVVEDMLLLSRLEHDQAGLDLKPLELTPFMGDIYEGAKILADKKEIEVIWTEPQNDISVRADENALRRVFLNILDNAVKFTPEHGRITISTQFDNAFVRTAISDTGCGVPQTELPKIFDKFYHKDQGAAIPGNGLGLSIALSIAKAHQGDLQVQSQMGHGTTFSISLPILK